MRRFVAWGIGVLVCAAAPAAEGAVPQPAEPRAVVVLVPGSGFNGAGPERAERMMVKVATWRRWGFWTVVAGYRRGRAGRADTERVIRRAAEAAPDLALCVYGESSGGTWALLAAARISVVDCVVVFAAPVDQETLARSGPGPARHLARDVWPRYFGPAGRDDGFEPFDVWSGGAPPVPVLAVYSEGDRVVPVQQGRLFAPLSEAVQLRVLPEGPQRFVHANVAPGPFVDARRAARGLVTRVAREER